VDALLILFLLLFLIGSAFFSASETALFSLSRAQVRAYRRGKDPVSQQIASLVLRPRDLLVTILMLNISVNILVQNVTSHLFGTYGGWGLRVGVPLGLTLIFGEIIPKALAIQHNTRIAHVVTPILTVIKRVLKPIRKSITAITGFISQTAFFFLKTEPPLTREELQEVIESTEAGSVLDPEEAELIDGFLSLQDSSIKELMRPREDVLYYDLQQPISRLIHLFVDQEVSRLPICDGGIENIVGVLSARQYFVHRDQIVSEETLRRFLKKPFFVPETAPARQLLLHFEEREEKLALVVDEYGAFAGLIAREDLVEEVIGEIQDRRDKDKRFTRAGDSVIITSGKFELDEFEEVFGVQLKSNSSMVTIGGWLTEQLGDIPVAGTKFEAQDFLFHVLSAEPNRVRRVYIRKLKSGERSNG
jgi:putative hemolysin